MMHFTSLLRMGGYADYVWPAFSIVIVLLLVNSLLASHRLRKMIKRLRKHYESSS